MRIKLLTVARSLLYFGLTILVTLCVTPVWGAERISFFYPPFGQFNVYVEDLEIFAQEGRVTKRFSPYADLLSQQERKQLRNVLQEPIPFNEILAYQLTQSELGQRFLEELTTISTKPQRSSFYFWRAAIVNAASKPEGLTILNILRQYDAKTIWLNFDGIKNAIAEASSLLSQKNSVIAAIKQQATTKTGDTPINSELPNLTLPGSTKWQKETFSFTRSHTQTIVKTALYLPQDAPDKAPVVVIAPGLAESIDEVEYLAQHLASYGFGVAILNFPESGDRRIRQYLSDLNTLPSTNEWVEQPKDITALLDRLSKNPHWRSQLNLQRVGVLGHSLGGYTSLALGGAKVNWQAFQQACARAESKEQLIFNLSILWQCASVKAVRPSTELRDKRVAAVLAANPVSNPIFEQEGMSQIAVPTMLIAGSEDMFAPPVPEQILPFTWIKKRDKYLTIVKRGNHFSFLSQEGTDVLPLPDGVVGSDEPLARSYLKALSVAFFKTYIGGQMSFKQYLSSSYVESLSRKSLPISLLKSLTQAQVEQASQLFEKER